MNGTRTQATEVRRLVLGVDRIALSGLVAVVLLVAAVGGCKGNGSGQTIDLPAGSESVATIDGEHIPSALYLATARAYRLDPSTKDGREQTLRRLTDFVVLAHMAKREDFASDSGFAARVELGRLQGTAGATMQALEQRANIDETAIKATYDKQAATSGGIEYDFTQLLFANEDAALKAEGDIVAGKPFAEVFDNYRKEALQARSFHAAHANQLPEDLAKAISKLKPGDATQLPVHTSYGWHVVHLDATRPFQPPPLDSVKNGIRSSLASSFAETRLAKLRENARVELNTAALDAAGAAKVSPDKRQAPSTDKPHDAVH